MASRVLGEPHYPHTYTRTPVYIGINVCIEIKGLFPLFGVKVSDGFSHFPPFHHLLLSAIRLHGIFITIDVCAMLTTQLHCRVFCIALLYNNNDHRSVVMACCYYDYRAGGSRVCHHGVVSLSLLLWSSRIWFADISVLHPLFIANFLRVFDT